MGGVGQIGAGVAACSTVAGCVVGAPLIVLGVSNVGEAATGFLHPNGEGFNLTQAALQEGFSLSGETATAANAVVNLSADIAGLNILAVPKHHH